MSIMISTIIVVICTASTLQLTLAEPQCHGIEVLNCFDYLANYVNSLPKRSTPQASEITDLCKAGNSFIDCWDDYKKRCMSPMQAELEVLLTEGFRNLETQLCTDGLELHAKYVKYSECYSKALKVDKASDNIDRIMVMIETFDTIPNLKKIRFACCSWNQMYSRTMKVMDDTCGADAVNGLEDAMAIAISELPQVLCQSFEPESDKCQEILPPEGSKPSGKETPYTYITNYFFKTHI